MKYSLKNTLTGVVRITRPQLGALAAIYLLLGGYLTAGMAALFSLSILRGAIVVALIIAFGFVVNDFCDVSVDRWSKPYRPIPSGQISQTTAVILALILLIIAVSLVWSLNLWARVITLMNIILTVGYSVRLKNTLLIGNGVMGYLNATIILFGSLLIGFPTAVVWFSFLIMFLYCFALEVLYALVDQVGDSQAGLRTTAVRLGTSKTLRVYRHIVITLVVVALVPWMIGLASNAYLYTMIIFVSLPLATNILILHQPTRNNRFILACQVTRVCRVVGLIPMILLKQ
jgi:geranylgeranylglycerol-phosphate geranylgeranyltransferase